MALTRRLRLVLDAAKDSSPAEYPAATLRTESYLRLSWRFLVAHE